MVTRLDNGSMSSAPTPRLHRLFAESADELATRRLARTSAAMRMIPFVALLATLATIPLDLRMSAATARDAGTAVLTLIAGVVLVIGVAWRRSLRERLRILADVIRWSDGVAHFTETGDPLTGAERQWAVRHVRSMLDRAFGPTELLPGMRVRKSSEEVVPDLPLPRSVREGFVRTVNLVPGSLVAVRLMTAPWLVLLWFWTWTASFVVVWGNSPDPCEVGAATCSGALQGFGVKANLGDFVFLVLNSSAASFPPDLAPRVGSARAVFGAAFVSALLLLGVAASSLWARVRDEVRAAAPRSNEDTEPDPALRTEADAGAEPDSTAVADRLASTGPQGSSRHRDTGTGWPPEL